MHHDCFPQHSDEDSSYTEANRENECIDPEKPAAPTPTNGTPYLDSCLASKTVISESSTMKPINGNLFSREEASPVTHCRVRHNFTRAAINMLFRIPKMTTFSNFTLSHTSFKRFNPMTYVIDINCWKWGTGSYSRLVDPKNLRDDDSTFFHYCNSVVCIKFLMQQPAFREHRSYAPAKEFNEAVECIH